MCVSFAQSQRVRLQDAPHLTHVAFQRRQFPATAAFRRRVTDRTDFRSPLGVAAARFRFRFAVRVSATGLAGWSTRRRAGYLVVSGGGGHFNLLPVFDHRMSGLAEAQPDQAPRRPALIAAPRRRRRVRVPRDRTSSPPGRSAGDGGGAVSVYRGIGRARRPVVVPATAAASGAHSVSRGSRGTATNSRSKYSDMHITRARPSIVIYTTNTPISPSSTMPTSP